MRGFSYVSLAAKPERWWCKRSFFCYRLRSNASIENMRTSYFLRKNMVQQKPIEANDQCHTNFTVWRGGGIEERIRSEWGTMHQIGGETFTEARYGVAYIIRVEFLWGLIVVWLSAQRQLSAVHCQCIVSSLRMHKTKVRVSSHGV